MKKKEKSRWGSAFIKWTCVIQHVEGQNGTKCAKKDKGALYIGVKSNVFYIQISELLLVL